MNFRYQQLNLIINNMLQEGLLRQNQIQDLHYRIANYKLTQQENLQLYKYNISLQNQIQKKYLSNKKSHYLFPLQIQHQQQHLTQNQIYNLHQQNIKKNTRIYFQKIKAIFKMANIQLDDNKYKMSQQQNNNNQKSRKNRTIEHKKKTKTQINGTNQKHQIEQENKWNNNIKYGGNNQNILKQIMGRKQLNRSNSQSKNKLKRIDKINNEQLKKGKNSKNKRDIQKQVKDVRKSKIKYNIRLQTSKNVNKVAQKIYPHSTKYQKQGIKFFKNQEDYSQQKIHQKHQKLKQITANFNNINHTKSNKLKLQTNLQNINIKHNLQNHKFINNLSSLAAILPIKKKLTFTNRH